MHGATTIKIAFPYLLYFLSAPIYDRYFILSLLSACIYLSVMEVRNPYGMNDSKAIVY
jgi:hypothetical protein